jgi:hypothetical protein
VAAVPALVRDTVTVTACCSVARREILLGEEIALPAARQNDPDPEKKALPPPCQPPTPKKIRCYWPFGRRS